jgi:hypothetical protein
MAGRGGYFAPATAQQEAIMHSSACNRVRTLLLSALFAGVASAVSAGTVDVSFVNPSSFEDAGTTSWEEQANLNALAAHLAALGQRLLPAHHTLKVEVLDVDLAGSVRPSRGGSSVRVLRGGADWPRIKLRYVLQAEGKTVSQGEEWVADTDYARGVASAYRDSPSLFYEKRMLDAWFKARFAEVRTAAG